MGAGHFSRNGALGIPNQSDGRRPRLQSRGTHRLSDSAEEVMIGGGEWNQGAASGADHGLPCGSRFGVWSAANRGGGLMEILQRIVDAPDAGWNPMVPGRVQRR